MLWQIDVKVLRLPQAEDVATVKVEVHTNSREDFIDAIDMAEHLVMGKWPGYYVEAISVNGLPVTS